MDFDPTEIRRMMEKRQRELRGNRPVPEDALSPSKRSRQEKENEAIGTSSPQKQGFMAKFAVSPKHPRRDTAASLSQASPSTRARLNEVSKRYAELEDELPKRPGSPGDSTSPKKKTAPQPPNAPKAQKKRAPSPPNSESEGKMSTGDVRKKWEITERTTVTVTHGEASRPVEIKVSSSTKRVDPSEANVAHKAKQFDKPEPSSLERSTLPKSKVVPRGKIADKISQFNVAGSGPRCEIDTKPMASVSARAKFFEKAMEADKKAADAVYVPVSQRTTKYFEQHRQASNERVLVVPSKPAACNTVVSPGRKRDTSPVCQTSPEVDTDEALRPDEEVSKSSEGDEPQGNRVESDPLRSEPPDFPKPEQSEPKKVGSVSSKLKNRLQDLIVNGHQTPDDTLLSISEKIVEHQPQALDQVAEEGDEDFSECRPEDELLMSPQIVKQSEKFMDDDTISRITGIPEDGHSTPKPCASLAENAGTPLRKTMSQYRRDEREAQQREANVQRIVYQIPSNMMEEIRRGKEEEVDDEGALESYKRQMEDEMLKQESIMKQTSHALMVCQDNGDKGSEQQVEAERLLLIATQRHHVAQTELQRINIMKNVSQSGGTLTICDIKLPYKNEFLKLMRQCNDVLESTHYFIVLVRSGASLLHTELVSTNEKILGGSVSLNHHMVLKNLQEGFRVFVDVYAVQALNRNHPDYEATIKKIRREKEKESNKGGGILSAFTPSKKKTQGTPHNEEVKIRKPSFGLIGRVTLDEGLIALDKQVHYLDNYFNESPLDGRIYMKIQLNMPDKVHHCGMLRLKDSNGFMSSFFAAIEGSHLNLWNDIRAAENEQEPLRSFELSQAVDVVRVEQSFSFFYFPLKLSGGVELQFLTYAEDESNKWADKLNACITRYSKN